MSDFKGYILALDFDGVLWDSVGECWLCCTETLKVDFGKAVSSDSAVQDAFHRGRWLVRTGGDFLLVYELAIEDPKRDFDAFTKADFQKLRESESKRVAEFEKKFYARRELLRENETQRWLDSQKPYPEVVAQFAGLKEAFDEVVLITTKDGPSARKLLESADIELAIWSRETGVDKGEQILDLCKKRNHTPDKILFIDDLLENLEQTRRVGTPGFLAEWGYNNPAEQKAALDEGYKVLKSHDLVGQLAGLI